MIFSRANVSNEKGSQLEEVTGKAFLSKDGRDLGMLIC